MVVDTEPLHGQHVATGGDLVDLGKPHGRQFGRMTGRVPLVAQLGDPVEAPVVVAMW